MSKPTLKDYYGFKLLNNPIGIEVEVEFPNRPGPEINNKIWTTKREGSLRYYGSEYINTKPITVQMKRKVIDQLLSTILEHDPILDSPRTSVHVHTNVLMHTPVQIWNVVVAYWLAENLLFKYCGEDREGNLFCLRLCDAEGILKLCINDVLRTSKRVRPFDSFNIDIAKYCGLNLNAITRFGSVEFRGMRGTLDADIMDTWSTEVYNIVDRVKQYEHPEHVLDSYFKLGVKEFLYSILSKPFVDHLTSTNKDWYDLVDSNVGRVIDLAYLHDWNKWEEKVEKSISNNPDYSMYVPPRANRHMMVVDAPLAPADPIRMEGWQRAARLIIEGDNPVRLQDPDEEV